MNPTAWHVDRDLATAYAESRTDPVLTASLEQHVVACASCRALLGEVAPPPSLDAGWLGVLERVQRPTPRPLERLLTRLGVDPGTARLAALTPSLRGAWLAGVVLVLALALVTAYSDPDGVAVFLALAPLLPVAGVALAFGPHSDPAHEMVAASPYPAPRLLAVRTALVVATTLAPAGVAGVLLPGGPWLAAAWLLPALALATTTVAVGSRLSPVATASALAGAWALLAGSGLTPRGNPELVAGLPVQALCLALFLISALALVRERHDLDQLLRRTA